MDEFLSEEEKDLLSNHVRYETLQPCYKQTGKKDAQPHFKRPSDIEVRALAKLIGLSGAALGLRLGVDARSVRNWQSPGRSSPSFSEWILICQLAIKVLHKSSPHESKM